MPGLRYTVLAIALFLTAVFTLVITPKQQLTPDKNKIDLEQMIPEKFGDWVHEPDIIPVSAIGADEDKFAIYSQVLMRTYKNSKSERIMFTIAYGSDQSDNLQVHRPEVCYAFQGFQVSKAHSSLLSVHGIMVPVKQLVAVNGARNEPITYWIMIGDRPVSGKLDRKIEQLKYGLTGKIPDGMLIRISNISRDVEKSYRLHEQFINDLYSALDDKNATRIIGKPQK